MRSFLTRSAPVYTGRQPRAGPSLESRGDSSTLEALQRQGTHDPLALQAWLGHRSPETTQRYARITPTTLAKADRKAGYFARNVRTVKVLLDREAVQNGAASSGTPWQYLDLGHGFCTYSFFEQCPHRMACAHCDCDFYLPKTKTTS
jgi:hypothetical protein